MTDSLFDLVGIESKERSLWDLYPKEKAELIVDQNIETAYVQWFNKGVEITFDPVDDQWILSAIFLYVQGTEEFAAFSEPLPRDLEPGMDRAKIEVLLGPAHADGGDKTGEYGYVPPWIWYGIKLGVRLHISFREGSIKQVTVCRPAGLSA